MVKEAEQFKADDEVQRDRVSAKNSLESYAFNMKQTMDDEQVKGKVCCHFILYIIHILLNFVIAGR
jgi:hypothetical protein